jgi:hypothetical protein
MQLQQVLAERANLVKKLEQDRPGWHWPRIPPFCATIAASSLVPNWQGREGSFPAYFFALAKGRIKSYHCRMMKKKVSLTVPPDYLAHIDEIAVRSKRSRSSIIAEAIGKYLDNGHKPAAPPATKKKAGTR